LRRGWWFTVFVAGAPPLGKENKEKLMLLIAVVIESQKMCLLYTLWQIFIFLWLFLWLCFEWISLPPLFGYLTSLN